jgi:DNA (cytosine-5)-methyltransferase 1
VLLPLMAERGWRGAAAWAATAKTIGPTIVGGSKKHGGPDLGPTRAKQAWAKLGVDARGVADVAPGPDDAFEIGPKLTCEMVARIQGWDDEEFPWKFVGRKTNVYRQIGNAFPPPVARALGTSIAAALRHVGEAREAEPLQGEIDPLYRALKDADDYLSAGQLMRRTGLNLDAPELDRRISILSQDFDIEKVERTSGGIAYKLGRFRAFTGQSDHARHDFFRTSLSKVS